MAAYAEALINQWGTTHPLAIGRATTANLALGQGFSRTMGAVLPVAYLLESVTTTSQSYGMQLVQQFTLGDTTTPAAAYSAALVNPWQLMPVHQLGQGASPQHTLALDEVTLVGRGVLLNTLLSLLEANSSGFGTSPSHNFAFTNVVIQGLSADLALTLNLPHKVALGFPGLVMLSLGLQKAAMPSLRARSMPRINITFSYASEATAGLHEAVAYWACVSYSVNAGDELIGWVYSNEAMWEYTGLNVLGMTILGNTLYVANTTGIYKLTGTASVDARLDTGDIDMGTQQHKRVPQVWIDRGNSPGDYLEAIVNDTAYRYPLDANLRYRIGRGLESVYWRMSFYFPTRVAFSKILLYPLVMARNLIRGKNDPREP